MDKLIKNIFAKIGTIILNGICAIGNCEEIVGSRLLVNPLSSYHYMRMANFTTVTLNRVPKKD